MDKAIGHKVHEIRLLAERNKFKDIVKILSDLVHRFEKSPRRLIAVLTLRIFYNIQLNANQSIVSDFNLIKSPYSERWLYESYPDKYGDRRGTMCPFSLNLMYAYYPYLMGSMHTALDRLHALREQLEQQMQDARAGRDRVASQLVSVDLLVADILLAEQRPVDALTTLVQLKQGNGADCHATNAMLAVVYNQLGDLANAQKHIELAIDAASPFTEFYRGLHHVINRDFEGAHGQFSLCRNQAAAHNTSIAVSAAESLMTNNIAVALFYMNRTVAAKTTIDTCKHAVKTYKLFKGVIWNTTMLKELAVDIDGKSLEEEAA